MSCWVQGTARCPPMSLLEDMPMMKLEWTFGRIFLGGHLCDDALTHLFTNSFTRSTWPCWAAIQAAVNPCLFLASIFAPALRSRSTSSMLPWNALISRGVNNWWVLHSTSAPALTRISAACYRNIFMRREPPRSTLHG